MQSKLLILVALLLAQNLFAANVRLIPIDKSIGVVETFYVDNGNIYVGTYDKGIFCTTDKGANWDSRNTGLSNSDETYSIVTKINSKGSFLFSYSNNKICFSTNSGQRWFAFDYFSSEDYYTGFWEADYNYKELCVVTNRDVFKVDLNQLLVSNIYSGPIARFGSKVKYYNSSFLMTSSVDYKQSAIINTENMDTVGIIDGMIHNLENWNGNLLVLASSGFYLSDDFGKNWDFYDSRNFNNILVNEGKIFNIGDSTITFSGNLKDWTTFQYRNYESYWQVSSYQAYKDKIYILLKNFSDYEYKILEIDELMTSVEDEKPQSEPKYEVIGKNVIKLNNVEQSSISVFNINGVRFEKALHSGVLDLNDLPNGVYLIYSNSETIKFLKK